MEGEDEDGEDGEEENEPIMAWDWNGGWENEGMKGVEGRKWRSNGGGGVVRVLRG